ncbi:hypothetical protein PoB_000043100 [Plakobranchus ocellatus]|uniref:Uncharacterized protein n=1 Tax=Plakobranchus ocellatus TaxID=259542 RepID=A0AAV3WTR2_9GAST|nr:hypothetical protein PoB_000043100 [Plakobranchus ocellatus]
MRMLKAVLQSQQGHWTSCETESALQRSPTWNEICIMAPLKCKYNEVGNERWSHMLNVPVQADYRTYSQLLQSSSKPGQVYVTTQQSISRTCYSNM